MDKRFIVRRLPALGQAGLGYAEQIVERAVFQRTAMAVANARQRPPAFRRLGRTAGWHFAVGQGEGRGQDQHAEVPTAARICSWEALHIESPSSRPAGRFGLNSVPAQERVGVYAGLAVRTAMASC